MARPCAGRLLSGCGSGNAWENTLHRRKAARTFAKQTDPVLMRHHLILVPLGLLLLSSCEPEDVRSDEVEDRRRKPDRNAAKNVFVSDMSHAQLSAQDSLGKEPLARNMVSAIDDICPLHHEKMRMSEIPIVFEDDLPAGTAHAIPSATAAFPFGAERIISAGNSLLPGEPHTARVYLCASCIAARKAAEEKRTPAAPPAQSE